MTPADDRETGSSTALQRAERGREEALAEAARLRGLLDGRRRDDQHRLRNMFSVIRAVVRRSADDFDTVEEYVGLLDGRLAAYINSQSAVMQDWSAGADLALLLAEALHTFCLMDGEQATLEGPAVKVASEAAGLLALVFHELASQVIDAFPDDPPRHSLHISWSIEHKDMERPVAISWAETIGSGDNASRPDSSWAGWIANAIEYQLGGSLKIRTTNVGRAVELYLPRSVLG